MFRYLVLGWQKAVSRRYAKSARVRPSGPRQTRFRPLLETLEDRLVPSTLTVHNNLDDGSAGSLRATIAAAASGDTIVFDKSLNGKTITLSATKGELDLTKSLDIEGPGANKLTISGNDATCVFHIMGSANVAISGLTVAHGFVSGNPSYDFGFTYVGGGGILVDFGAQLTLVQDAITANHALGVVGSEALGGGLMNLGTATLVGCDFTNNQATGGGTPLDAIGGAGGGAVDNFGGPLGGASLIASNCTFTNNSTRSADGGDYFAVGGAFENDGGLAGSLGIVPLVPEPSTAVLSNCVFSNNVASAGLTGNGQGGGVLNTGVGTVLTLSGCTVNGNRAIGGDGGDGSGVTGYSEGQGGGLYNVGGSTMNVVGCTVTNNQAIGGNNGIISDSNTGGAYVGEGIAGGILNNFGGILTVTNSTISGNVAKGGDMTTQPGPGGFANGGGIANTAGFLQGTSMGGPAVAMTLTNCLISNNSAIGGHGNAGINTLMAPDQKSGFGFGGGIDNSNGGSAATIINTVITGNHAIGGAGGTGNTGSDGLGGGIGVGFTIVIGSASLNGGVDGSTVTLIASTLGNNQAVGGAGGAGANGGNGYGGGLAVMSTCSATATASTITNNEADGGHKGSGPHTLDGQGIGGGVYYLGTFTDILSVIKKNHASTSNNDIYTV